MNALPRYNSLIFLLTGIIYASFFTIDIAAADLSYLSRADRLNGWRTLEVLDDLFRDHRASVVEILDNDKQVALGTVVSEDGFIVTKASEFGQSLEIRLSDYSKHVAEQVSVDEANDLALLKIRASGLRPVDWPDSGDPQMGQWVMSPYEDKTQVRIGVISALTRQVPKQFGALGVVTVDSSDYLTENDLLDPNTLADHINKGARPIDRWLKNEISNGAKSALTADLNDPIHQAPFLKLILRDLNFMIFERTLYAEDRFVGVSLSETTQQAILETDIRIRPSVLNRMLLVDCFPDLIRAGKSGARILDVVADSAAEQADLEPGDLIMAINASGVGGSQDLVRLIRKHTAGETITISLIRDGSSFKKLVTLGFFDATFPDQDVNIALSGDISDRRTGFQKIIQHDMPLSPKSMGGPLMDLEGQVLGINIARYDRVATYALPADLVQSLIQKMK
ncbi:S1C family serine protease [Verrucomicrobia bacterium]|nr:S1C family serine protease [Verrucomicrobiota bacterium]